MQEELLPIGKMAALNRVSISTLRLYDEKGLLKPRYTDPQTGYRYYHIDQNARLDMIVYMKELGMSLAQIAQDALQQEDMSLIEEIFSQKNEQIHQQMRHLKAQHDAVERAILSIERYRKSPVTGTFSLEYIDRRYAWGVPCADNFYQDDVHSYERLCATCACGWRTRASSRSTPTTSAPPSPRRISRKSGSWPAASSSSPAAGTRATPRPTRWWRAACTPASTWTTTTTRCTTPGSCGPTAGKRATTSPGTTSARCSPASTCSTTTPAAMFMRLQVPVTFQKGS